MRQARNAPKMKTRHAIAYFVREGLYYVRAIGPRKLDEWREIARGVQGADLGRIVGATVAARILAGDGESNPWCGKILR